MSLPGDSGSAAPAALGVRIGRYRYVVVGVVWLTFCLGALDRASISLLLVDPGFLRDMGLVGSPERQGLVMTMLLLPYAFSNVFLSASADRWGPRRVLTVMTVLWSVAAAFLGMVASYPVLLAGRAIRGLAEGPLFPVANRYIRNWFPPSERGGANAIWTSGSRVGLAVAVPVLTAAIAAFGWRFSFYLQAGLILAAVVPAIWFLTANRPEEMRRVGRAEVLHISPAQTAVAGNGSRAQEGLPGLLRNYRYWLAVCYHFANLAVYFGLITWLPTYLRDARGFDVAGMVLFASLPHLLSTATSLPMGFLSDRLGRQALFCTGSLAGASACVCLAALAANPIVSASLIVLGFGSWGIGTPAYYAIMQRLIPGRIMATGIGIDNGLANLGAAMAPTIVGILIATTGTYLAGLLFLAAVGVAGSLAGAVLAAQRY